MTTGENYISGLAYCKGLKGSAGHRFCKGLMWAEKKGFTEGKDEW